MASRSHNNFSNSLHENNNRGTITTNNNSNNSRINVNELIREIATTSSSTSIRSEIGRLFRPHVPTTTRSYRTQRSQRMPAYNNRFFYKEIILLTNYNCNTTLSGSGKAKAHQEGRIITGKILRSWDQNNIKNYIRDIFSTYLRQDDEIDILLPVFKDLVTPRLLPTEELNGENIYFIFRMKPLYIRPQRLLNYARCNESSLEEFDDEFLEEISNTEINNSLLETTCNDNYCESKQDDQPAEEILKEFIQKNTLTDQSTTFNIYRAEIFKCAIRTLERPSFNPMRRPFIIFTDVDSVSEGAIDDGGPSREFFRLILKYIKSYLFEGPDESKIIILKAEALQQRLYFYTGCLMGMSLIHGGPSPTFFSDYMFNLFIGKSANPDISNIHDEEFKTDLIRLEETTNLEELNELLSKQKPYFVLAGCPIFTDSFSKKDDIYKGILEFHLNHRLRPAIEQFINGFKFTKLYDIVVANAEKFRPLFSYQNTPLTTSVINSIFTICLSETGSSRRAKENRALAYFRDILIDCEENIVPCKLENILEFVTCLSCIPPLGFNIKPSIKFLHDESIYPRANTCSMELWLPTIHTTYDSFKEKIIFAVMEGMVFGFE